MVGDTQEKIAVKSPFVVQHQNPHDYMQDFEEEDDLYHGANSILRTLVTMKVGAGPHRPPPRRQRCFS
jgi:hypothetical protein